MPRSKPESMASEALREIPAAAKAASWIAFTFSLGIIRMISAPIRGAKVTKLSMFIAFS